MQDAKLFRSDLDLNNLDPNSVSIGTTARLALNGDFLFVSAPFGAANGVMSGKVYVYQRGAGTVGPYGQPGVWGEIAQLSPSDGSEGDEFGTALYAVDDGLFVSARKQGVGKVYFFRNPAVLASSSGSAPQATLAWSEVYSFTTSTNGQSTRFGQPIVGSGNTIVMGDQFANGNRGGGVAYPKDALFAVDPNATPIPTATAEPTEPPIELEPCGFSQEPTQEVNNFLFMPMAAGGLGSANAAAATQPAQPQGVAQATPLWAIWHQAA